MGNLLESYSSIQAELRYVNECKLNNQLKVSDADAIKSLMKELNINDLEILKNWQRVTLLSTDQKLLIEYAHFRFKRRCIIEELIESNSEASFLRYKDRLDRVLYSILRVSEQDLAYHLYYSMIRRNYW